MGAVAGRTEVAGSGTRCCGVQHDQGGSSGGRGAPRSARVARRVGALSLVIACTFAHAVPAGATETRPVFVLGDSVTVGATPAIEADAAAHGWAVTIDARIGRPTDEGADILASMQGRLPAYVVVELGNNDGENPDTLAARVDAVMHDLAGVRHVVWFTMSPFASWVPDANAVLQSASHRWANLELADWATVAETTPGALSGGGPHLQPAGAQAFADLMYREIDALARADDADHPAPVVLSGLAPFPATAPAPVFAPEPPRASVLGLNATQWGSGQPLVDADGGVFAFAGARFYGSMGTSGPIGSIVAVRPTATGRGYWLVAADGGVLAFGDARFCGTAGTGAGAADATNDATNPAPQGIA
jgi:lysophospholipase L1-like esterase